MSYCHELVFAMSFSNEFLFKICTLRRQALIGETMNKQTTHSSVNTRTMHTFLREVDEN